MRAGFLPLSLMILVMAALIVPLPLYLERPGSAVSLEACVELPSQEHAPVRGDYLLTTINVQLGTVVDTALGIADEDTRVVRREQLIPPGVDSNAYFRRQREVFASTSDVAAVVGLQAAGYDVELRGDGIQVLRTVEGAPATGILEAGDVITHVGGEKVSVDTQLREAVAALPEGEALALRVRRGGQTLNVEVVPRLIQGRPVIGILPQTINPRVNLPVDVEVNTGPIGGPSAGLMLALTIFDKISDDVDLSAGRVIAGTGSIDPSGRVGPIGGVGLKVLAADRGGADIFLAPAADFDAAAGAVPPDSPLRVVAVETFEQARMALTETESGPPRSSTDVAATCPYDPA